ncbi:tRNA dimethylallyltransferase [Nitrospira sp.]|nr:tRNA dimethylallyltransferase [Nitrospira sp.]
MIERLPHANERPIVVFVGPTAVGKSAVALRVARALNTEVLAADSRQVYRGMDIATDKPNPEQQAIVPHRLIDLVDPDEPFNAGSYRRAAEKEIARLHAAGKLPLIVGGTGLYVRVLLHGLCGGPEADPALRAELESEADRLGSTVLHRRLAERDPIAAARVHPNDRRKVIRALEVYDRTGQPLSVWHKGHAFAQRPYRALLIGLQRDRQALYARIEERIDSMLRQGVIEETAHLLAKGYGRELGAMKGLGYKQIAGYLVGDYDRDEAVRLLKRDTRRFAKRQLTWFRKEPGIHWLTLESDGNARAEDQGVARALDMIRRFLDEVPIGPTSVPVEGGV